MVEKNNTKTNSNKKFLKDIIVKLFIYGSFSLSVIGTITNMILGSDFFSILSTFSVAIFMGTMILFIEKIRNYKKPIFFLNTIILWLFLPWVGITNNGIEGAILLFYLLDLIIINIFFSKKKWLLMMMFFVLSSSLVAYSSINDYLIIVGYSEGYLKHIDIIINFIASSFFVVIIIKTVINEYDEIFSELQEVNRKLAHSNITDSNTGLKTKDYLYQTVKSDFKNKKDIKSAILMFDLDDFKHINDTYGHLIGDVLLKEIGTFINHFFDNTSCAARYGGDEFLIYISDYNDRKMLLQKIERFRKGLYNNLWTKNEIKITISGGFTFLDKNHNLEQDLEKVDKALYKSKENGKNRITIV